MGNQFSWQRLAACRGVPSYIFFTDETRPKPKDDLYAGKTYKDWCCSCIVKIKCREFANIHDLQGVWGDSTETDREAANSKADRKELREFKEETGEYWPLYGHS